MWHFAHFVDVVADAPERAMTNGAFMPWSDALMGLYDAKVDGAKAAAKIPANAFDAILPTLLGRNVQDLSVDFADIYARVYAASKLQSTGIVVSVANAQPIEIMRLVKRLEEDTTHRVRAIVGTVKGKRVVVKRPTFAFVTYASYSASALCDVHADITPEYIYLSLERCLEQRREERKPKPDPPRMQLPPMPPRPPPTMHSVQFPPFTQAVQLGVYERYIVVIIPLLGNIVRHVFMQEPPVTAEFQHALQAVAQQLIVVCITYVPHMMEALVQAHHSPLAYRYRVARAKTSKKKKAVSKNKASRAKKSSKKGSKKKK